MQGLWNQILNYPICQTLFTLGFLSAHSSPSIKLLQGQPFSWGNQIACVGAGEGGGGEGGSVAPVYNIRQS